MQCGVKSEAELIINGIRKGMNRNLKSLGFAHHEKFNFSKY